MNCPVCGTKAKEDNDYMDFILMESDIKCVDGCGLWGEEFVTGGYREGIKVDGEWQEWTWSYCTPESELATLQKEKDVAMEQAKKELAGLA